MKIFQDWPEVWPDPADDPPFGPEDPITYPVETLAQTVRAVEDAGGRVAVHAFGKAGADASVEAGVHCIEHGWELEPHHFEAMARRDIAWVPILSISRPMVQIAERKGLGWQRDWIHERMAAMHALVPAARAAGVLVLAGTDWFPAVSLAGEIRALHGCGMSTVDALGAGSWSARRYLEEPGIEAGAPADLVVYEGDPREDLEVLDRPAAIFLSGERVQ